MSIAKCPLCGEKIKINTKPRLGQHVECPACDAVLEVIRVSPLTLDWPCDDEGYSDANYDDEEFDEDEDY